MGRVDCGWLHFVRGALHGSLPRSSLAVDAEMLQYVAARFEEGPVESHLAFL